MTSPLRDTDADWRRLGDTDPYWGVLTSPEFRREALTDAAREQFYASGRSDVAGFVHEIGARLGVSPPWRRALDVGCGVGRLSEAMTAHAGEVIGYDISEGMLSEARARGGAATYVSALPDGPFDWVSSYIVFQHIPPERGYALLDAVLARLAPGGVASLHFTVDRHPHAPRPPVEPAPTPRRLLRRGAPPPAPPRPVGQVSMYDYDLNRVTAAFRAHDVKTLGLAGTEHGGHYGYMIVGLRGATQTGG